MRIIKKHVAIFILVLQASLVVGQMDTLLYDSLESVTILDVLDRKPFQKTISNSGSTSLSLSATLDRQSFATIRTGGPSVLSTLLHRGMASRHIAILWGGFNIQSATNGSYDIGLINNSFDRVVWNSTSMNALAGNASIAGAIQLDNALTKKNQTKVSLSVGSSKNKTLGLINSVSIGRYSQHFAFQLNDLANQYGYYNGLTRLTQESAEMHSWNLNYKGSYRFSEKIAIQGGLWLQKAERRIPPTKTSVNIVQKQEDENYRGFLQSQFYLNAKNRIVIRGAFFNEILDFQTPAIDSRSNTDVYNTSIDYFHHSGLAISAQYRIDDVTATFFTENKLRKTTSFFIDYKKKIKSLNIQATIRPEWVDGKNQPLILDFNISRLITDRYTTSLNYGKGYNLPSFNDLYWPSAGNPDLKTEQSQSLEWRNSFESLIFPKSKLSITLYRNVINDWIQWTPINGIFEPTNQRKVRNRGVEFEWSHSNSFFNNRLLDFTFRYAFTNSQIVEHQFNDDLVGKNSLFIPKHKISSSLNYTYSTYSFLVNSIFYSKRYSSVDNSTFSDGYIVLDLEGRRIFNISKRVNLELNLTIHNLGNNNYEHIQFYPMPLRLFSLGVELNFK